MATYNTTQENNTYDFTNLTKIKNGKKESKINTFTPTYPHACLSSMQRNVFSPHTKQ